MSEQQEQQSKLTFTNSDSEESGNSRKSSTKSKKSKNANNSQQTNASTNNGSVSNTSAASNVNQAASGSQGGDTKPNSATASQTNEPQSGLLNDMLADSVLNLMSSMSEIETPSVARRNQLAATTAQTASSSTGPPSRKESKVRLGTGSDEDELFSRDRPFEVQRRITSHHSTPLDIGNEGTTSEGHVGTSTMINNVMSAPTSVRAPSPLTIDDTARTAPNSRASSSNNVVVRDNQSKDSNTDSKSTTSPSRLRDSPATPNATSQLRSDTS
eukprot:CAMPEP_0168583596 /NCGR_PEP_ID=MMETSP0420-20121227/2660_1 /TAXON_ID=498008 /ORGANISM="Pessonella sp." /LENGTH=270 /DNA_ID=CAMNT_0008618281 /DNA_START=15 /DNA_END=823 /DNA_ORIENTATION=+